MKQVQDEVIVRSDGLDVDEEDIEEINTNFTDKIVLRVSRPEDGYYSDLSSDQSFTAPAPVTPDSCSTFLIFGIMMGCLLIVASVMMCLLAYRLNTMAGHYKVSRSHVS